MDLTGNLTGSGTLNLRVPWVRTEIHGGWSAFSGTLNVTTDDDGGEFRFGKTSPYPGFPNAIVNLPERMTLLFLGPVDENAGTTVSFGALSGPPTARLRGGPTAGQSLIYRIGGRNTDATFAGVFEEQSAGTITHYVKTGSGTWKLAGSGSWNGSCTIEQGTLEISGNVGCSGSTSVSPGAALAMAGGTYTSDSISVASTAAIAGHGVLEADLNSAGKHTGRGFSGGSPGSLSISGSASFGDSSILEIRIGATPDQLEVGADLSLAGTLAVNGEATFGRYPIVTYAGALDLGEVAFTGVTNAHLSTATPGQLILVIDDSDEDGLPDSWEMLHMENLLSGPDDGPDVDGQPNSLEFRSGTDPRDASSTFAAALSRSDAGFELSWPSVPGNRYRIESSAMLDGQWQPVITIEAAAAPAVTTRREVALQDARNFYRVVLLPP